MKVEITWEERGIFVVVEGRFKTSEFLYHQNELLKDPRTPNIKYKIVDFTNADLSKLHVEDAYFAVSAAHEKALSMPGHIIAAVATEAHTVAFIETYIDEMIRLGVLWNMKIFKTLEEAREWINTQPVAGGDRPR